MKKLLKICVVLVVLVGCDEIKDWIDPPDKPTPTPTPTAVPTSTPTPVIVEHRLSDGWKRGFVYKPDSDNPGSPWSGKCVALFPGEYPIKFAQVKLQLWTGQWEDLDYQKNSLENLENPDHYPGGVLKGRQHWRCRQHGSKYKPGFIKARLSNGDEHWWYLDRTDQRQD